MKSLRRDLQRGITVLELMMVVMLIGVLGLVSMTRIMQAKDRGFVAAAQTDLTAVRQAMAMYAADYDAYPAGLQSVADLRATAVDRQGIPYLDLPSRVNFAWVSYELLPSDGYVLIVQANDHKHTLLRVTANGVYAAG